MSISCFIEHDHHLHDQHIFDSCRAQICHQKFKEIEDVLASYLPVFRIGNYYVYISLVEIELH